MAKTLTKADIFKANDIKVEPVEIPEWGGVVYVKTMSGHERDAFELSQMEGGTPAEKYADLRAKMVALTVCDEKGNRLFSVDDVQTLTKKSARALDRVFEVSQRLSRIGVGDIDKAAEDLDEGQREDSSSV